MSNTEPKVSIIIPAYNAEKYIERCLNSVVAQTMPDFECIIVDDGSTDKTAEIAKRFVLKDSRFKLLINTENQGQSASRQKALDESSGIYTIHVDSDDWVEPILLDELVPYAESTMADMVIFDWIQSTKEGDIYEKQCPLSLETRTIFCQMLRPDLHASLCNKLVKRSLYKRYGISFIPGMLMEDQYICLCLLSHPIKVEYLPKALYHYDRTQNPQSTVHRGILPDARLKPLELISAATDISIVQDSFDRAILYIAYEALFFEKEKCSNYTALFKKHLPSIYRAKGFPFRVKLLVWLRIHKINIPIRFIKKLFGR